MKLDELIRDLTKVHPQPKSYVRKLLSGFLLELKEEVQALADKYESDEIAMVVSLIDTKIGEISKSNI